MVMVVGQRMRITVIVDDQLFERARLRAEELNTTLSEIVNQALRDTLSARAPADARFSMPTYGNPERPSRHAPEGWKRVLDEEDRARLRR